MNGDHVYFVATGSPLIKWDVRSIQTVIEEMILDAEREILISVYTIGENPGDLLRLIEDAAARGIRIMMLINRMGDLKPALKETFDRMLSKYPNLKIYSFDHEKYALHMKVFAVDRKKVLIGSANLTWKGLVENLELGVVVEGESAEKVSRLLEDLAASGIVSGYLR